MTDDEGQIFETVTNKLYIYIYMYICILYIPIIHYMYKGIFLFAPSSNFSLRLSNSATLGKLNFNI